MNTTVKYIEAQSDDSIPRKGGIHMKGLHREDRQPVHLMFLIDVSGSMRKEGRLDNVKRSIQFMLPFLSENDQISLTTFSDNTRVLLSHMAVSDRNKHAIEYQVNNMEIQGNTNLSAGLLECSMLLETPSEGRKQGLVLLTDGHANTGARDDTTLNQIVKSILTKAPGLSMTCVGYGETHNAGLMSKMSIEGGGSYNIVNNLEDVATVFGEILGGLLSVAVQMIEVWLPPGAECETVFPKETQEGGITRIRIGDIYAEAEQMLIFKSSPAQGPIRITGIALPTLARIDEIYEPVQLSETEEADPILKMTDYRQQVSIILKKVRTERVVFDTTYDEIKGLCLLMENSSFRDDPLVKMMLDDLRLILQMRGLAQGQTQLPQGQLPQGQLPQGQLPQGQWPNQSVLAQHEAYFGVARGLFTPNRISSSQAQAEAQGEGEGQEQEANRSVFSNTMQRRITQTIYATSLTAEEPR